MKLVKLTRGIAYLPILAQTDCWQSEYNADLECITVVIVRGKLCEETDTDRETYSTDPPEYYS